MSTRARRTVVARYGERTDSFPGSTITVPPYGSRRRDVQIFAAESRAGRLSMKELTENTARPGPGSP